MATLLDTQFATEPLFIVSWSDGSEASVWALSEYVAADPESCFDRASLEALPVGGELCEFPGWVARRIA